MRPWSCRYRRRSHDVAIEINLRLPSMLHGKKGFERIVWAFKHVMNDAVAWLFYDLEGEESSTVLEKSSKHSHYPLSLCEQIKADYRGCVLAPSPLSKHHPITKTRQVIRDPTAEVFMPGSFELATEAGTPAEIGEDWAVEVDEWLSLISLQSPRIEQGDSIDPYLCRYPKPDADGATTARLVCLRWSGFIPGQWLRHFFVILM